MWRGSVSAARRPIPNVHCELCAGCSTKQFRTALAKAGLAKDLVLYCSRHDYGTRVLNNTGNLAAVMKRMGHRDVRTAMQYQHPEPEMVRIALNRANGSALQTSV